MHVNLDPSHIDRHATVAAGVVGDATVVAEAMIALLKEAEHQPSSFRTADLEKKLQEYQSQGNVTGRGLQDIALALFNMKEFIYLK